jgi:hypothetical protein
MRKNSIVLATLAALGASSTLVAQTQWTGATDNVWLIGTNWSGGVVPNNNTFTARFDSVQINSGPTIGSATTIGALEFLSGAGPYSISGSALTIQRGSGTWITHSAGNTQTISNALILNATAGGSRSISITPGSILSTAAISATSTGATDTNVGVSGGGTLNLGGAFAGNQLSQGGATVININANQSAGTYVSQSNTGRVNLNANITNSRAVWLGNSASGSGRAFITTSGVSLASVVFRGDNNITNTAGIDIASGTVTGNITSLSIESARTNATHILSSSSNSGATLSVTGVFSGTAGAGTKVSIQGSGLTQFTGTGANTFNAPVEVLAGSTLALGKTAGTNAIPGGTLNSLNVLGSLRLTNSNQIANAVPMTLAGTFDLNSQDETLGALTITGSAGVLDLGSGTDSVVTFASLASFGSGLTINNWSGSVAGGGTEQILFTNTSGWTPAFLSQVTFTGFDPGAQFIGNELVPLPIPEPTTILGLTLVGSTLLMRRRMSV